MLNMTIADFLTAFEKHLSDTIDTVCGASPLAEGMRYAVLDGGKRIRPICVYLGASAATDGEVEADLSDQVFALASAVELIHAYSLVHDDLPAMDNDDMRRGKFSVHKQFGEANGILIGDALLSLAMRLLTDGCIKYGNRFAKAAACIAKAAADMADGQAYDLSGRKTESEFLSMYALKTGAMIKGAFAAGALCGGADENTLDAVESYAEHLGLAFQLADDLLDVGEDNSIVAVSGEQRVRKMLERETEQSQIAAERLNNCEVLKEFALKLCNREK